MTFQPALLEDNSIVTELIFSWFLQNSKTDYCQVCARKLKCVGEINRKEFGVPKTEKL